MLENPHVPVHKQGADQSQEQARNIQQYVGNVTSMCCRHLLCCKEKPTQQILEYAAPRATATSHGAMLRQNF